jgi:UDP-N-acetylmuramate dehydrogenase
MNLNRVAEKTNIMAIDQKTRQWLNQRFRQRVLFQEPMSRHTYFRVGGPADAFVTPEAGDELAALVGWLKENGVPYLVIGGGTNLLVKDGGIQGVVIAIGKGFDTISHEEKSGDAVLLTCGGGTKLQALCRYAVDQGLAGLNFAVGIPGTVGGGIVMNAGTRYGCIADVLNAATILDLGANRVKLPRKRMAFSYRSLDWGSLINSERDAGPIILEAEFGLSRSDSALLREASDRIAKERRLRQPQHVPSAGCFFKNPASGKTAGELIDRAGLKGRRIGDAEISVAHANFIVNKGAATASDILELRDLIQNTVWTLFNIQLETEVKIVGASA